jgi:hypothetical protein
MALSVVIFASCGGVQIPIDRTTQITNRPEVDLREDGTGIIRTVYCDISLRHLDNDDWKKISSYDVFSANSVYSSRKPPYTIFLATIHNSSESTIRDLRFSLKDGAAIIDAIPQEQIIKECTATRYRSVSLKECFTFRRLLSSEFEFEKIDFDRDTIGYPFSFIMPHDNISVFVALPVPRVELRQYAVRVNFTAGTDKKVVDFTIVRREHRSDQE